jgi:heptosyltransferase-1
LPEPQRILIVRTSALGDVVRAAPALVSLRRAYPGAQIDWLVADAFADAVRFHPALSGVVPFPKARLKAAAARGEFSELLEWSRSTLGEAGYDLAIDFQGLFRSGLLTFATRAAARAGFADAREGGWLFYNHRCRVEGGRAAHHVERNFALLASLGVEPVRDLRIYADPADRAALAEDRRLAGARYVLMSPTTKGAGRAWPMERYAAVARHLFVHGNRLGIDALVVVGLGSERGACRPLLSLPVVDRVGATSVSGLMALVERAALVVCNDSAAMHMAVAFGRPLVALFGPTDIGHAGPYGRTGDVISHKQAHERVRHRDAARAVEFMERITVEEVIAACEQRLGRRNTEGTEM